ncbi:MAG: M10 family metallopeptidase [Nitrosomonas sp.]
MPTPSTSSSVIATALTGDNLIDSLTEGHRWASTLITYSFLDHNSYFSQDPTMGYGPITDTQSEPWSTSFAPLSSSDQAYFNEALQQWANVANIQFQLTQESSSNVGDIRVAYSFLSSGAQAHAYGPLDGYAKAGDIWFNSDGTNASSVWKPGSYPFFATLHEIGHALGLKHPFSGSSTLPVPWDTESLTIMSYSANAGDKNSYFSFDPTTPMLLDILAIQSLYGPNNTSSGDNNYFFDDTQTYHETIWDSGGIDWIVYTGSQNSTIDLHEGHGSSVGYPVYVEYINTAETQVFNVWIAYHAVIEYAGGGSGNDTLVGNDADNNLIGGDGNDDHDGGYGNDQLVGGTGNDILRAGYGYDTLIGGSGNDTFGFYALGHFQASDFTVGEDRLFFDSSKIGVSNLHDLVGYITNVNQKSDGVTVEFGPNASIELVGINLNEITASMIVFAL